MRIEQTGYGLTDWSERAVWWIFNQRYLNWPIPAIARDMGENENTLRAWSKGSSLPDRRMLQRLRARYDKEGFCSFVLGTPSRAEVQTIIQEALSNIIKLSDYANDRKMAQEARAVARKVGDVGSRKVKS